MLPYEPLLKIVHSKIKCYHRKTQKTIRSGEIHTYNSKQYMIPLKQDQPFSCDQDVTILRSEDYFRINDLLQKKKNDKEEFLERIFELEKEIIRFKDKLKYYDNLEVDTKLKKLSKLENEISTLERKLKVSNKELSDANKTINSQKIKIEELKNKGVLGKINRFFPGSESEKEK